MAEVAAGVLEPSRREEWEALAADGRNGTLFHRLRFLDYHPADRFRFHHLVFLRGERLLAILPGALAQEGDATIYRSPAGASFGGPVFDPGVDPGEAGELIAGLLAYARARGWRRVELTPPPEVYWRGGHREFIAALGAAGFAPASAEVTQVVPLDGSEEDLWERLDRQARKAVRKSHREGLVVERSRDWDLFHPMLVADRARNGAVPTHSLEELRRLDALVGSELALFLARKGGDLTGGTLIFRASREVALNFYLCHRSDAQADRPSDILAWESLLWAKQAGCASYDFGTSSLGGVLNAGLWRFKSKFGAVDHPRVRYAIELG